LIVILSYLSLGTYDCENASAFGSRSDIIHTIEIKNRTVGGLEAYTDTKLACACNSPMHTGNTGIMWNVGLSRQALIGYR